MKYTGTVDIDCPRAKVVRLFSDSAYNQYWQEGFLKKILIEGKEREEGAVSEITLSVNKKEMILKETVISNNLPDSMEVFVEHQHMDNRMVNRFIAIDETTTRYVIEVEYTRINWIMPRLMAILFSGQYKKHGVRWMQNFKRFCEQGV